MCTYKTSPWGGVQGTTLLGEKYRVPLVQSYHTHLPVYIPRYTWAGLVKPMWDIIRIWTKKADVTMVTSTILQDELRGEGCPRLEAGKIVKTCHSFVPWPSIRAHTHTHNTRFRRST